MKYLIVTLKFICVGVIILLSACSNSIYEHKDFMSYYEGARIAGRDLGKGQFISLDRSPNRSRGFAVLTKDLMPNYKPKDFQKILKRRYGITQKYNDKVDFHYIIAYNSVMKAAIREKYGDNYYEQAQKEAFPGVKNFYRIR